MHQLISTVVANLGAMDPERVKSNAARRFRDAIEVPIATYLNLHAPSQTSENVYVTWVDAQNNIDNRLWQAQNKLLKGMDPRIAVALCSEAIVNDGMWVESAKNLSRIAPFLNANNFEGIVLFSTDDDRATFSPRRLVLLRGGGLAARLADALPEIEPNWYTVPLATRRPQSGGAGAEAEKYVRMLKAHRNVILKGVSGIGKSFVLGPVVESFGQDQTDFVVFHANSTYEDFVEALRPAGNAEFKVTDGRFLTFCKKAADSPEKDFLFIIDEINRAPAARVLGDLLYSLDPSKRINALVARQVLAHNDESAPLPVELDRESRPVRLQHERLGPNGYYRALFCVPDNVYILATRNTSDHSIGTMDIALGRRFKTERLEPLTAAEVAAVLLQRDERLSFLGPEILAWSQMNQVLDGVSPDACLGHSYFFDALRAVDNLNAADDTKLIAEFLWRDYLLPQLTEVLTTFDAGHLLPALETAASASTSSTGGHWVEARGHGLDVAYLVLPRTVGPTTPQMPKGQPVEAEGQQTPLDLIAELGTEPELEVDTDTDD